MKRAAIWLGALLPLAGCETIGAPSFIFFGAYFPAWLLCAFLGVAAGIAARVILVASGLADILPWQLLVCTAIAVIAGAASWLYWFGR